VSPFPAQDTVFCLFYLTSSLWEFHSISLNYSLEEPLFQCLYFGISSELCISSFFLPSSYRCPAATLKIYVSKTKLLKSHFTLTYYIMPSFSLSLRLVTLESLFDLLKCLTKFYFLPFFFFFWQYWGLNSRPHTC
jgi:hypothetical protein